MNFPALDFLIHKIKEWELKKIFLSFFILFFYIEKGCTTNIFEGHKVITYTFWFFNDKSWPLDIQNILHHISEGERKKYFKENIVEEKSHFLKSVVSKITDYIPCKNIAKKGKVDL